MKRATGEIAFTIWRKERRGRAYVAAREGRAGEESDG